MSKLKTFVAVLMLVFVLGLAAPQVLAGETQCPGALQTPPGETQTPPGEIQGPGFADWARIIFQILGASS